MRKIIKVRLWMDEVVYLPAEEKAKVTSLKVVNAENRDFSVWYFEGYKSLKKLDLSENGVVSFTKSDENGYIRTITSYEFKRALKEYAPGLKTIFLKNSNGCEYRI